MNEEAKSNPQEWKLFDTVEKSNLPQDSKFANSPLARHANVSPRRNDDKLEEALGHKAREQA